MQIKRYNRILQFLLLLLLSSSSLLISMATTVGGLQNSSISNSDEIHNLARFAVDQHNKKENAILELSRVVNIHEQVVAGTMHHLTLEVVDAGNKKLYLAKVWVKPWMDFKELHEFNHIGESTTSTPSDHSVQNDGEGSGYQSVPVHDSVVQDAANHLLETLQQQSNSLFPYELQEIVHAKAETVDGSTKYDILVKVKRSNKEEKFKGNVHKDDNGKFHVKNMVQDHS